MSYNIISSTTQGAEIASDYRLPRDIAISGINGCYTVN